MDEVKTEQTSPESENTPSMEDLQAQLAKLRDENMKLKNAQSSASADASKYKKALQERMTEQERAANETKELIEQLKAENAAMKKNQTLAEHTSGFLGIGFEADLAKRAAEATSEGNFSAMINAIKDFIVVHDKAIQADAMRNTPRPGSGTGGPTVTREQFDKMGYLERLKIYEEQPDLYQELTK